MTQTKIGSGPITLSPGVSNFYKENYLKKPGPEVFVVSKDGRFANYIFCGDGPGNCRSPIAVGVISDKCKERANAECYIFDENGYVVWDGPVKYANIANNSNSPQQNTLSERTLCALTTQIINDARAWETVKSSSMTQSGSKQGLAQFQAYIAEAQSRGLTPVKCSEILDDEPATTKTNAQPSPASNVEESLETIKRLLERGLISEEEAKQKRVEILEKIN